MSHLSVFDEQGKFFGVFSEDFDQHFSLDQFKIMQINPLKYIWRFSHSEKNLSGSMLDFNSMLDERFNHFSLDSQLFIAPVEGKHFGVKLEKKVDELPITKASQKLESNDDQLSPYNFSLNMMVSGILRHKGRKIYILDPRTIASYFRNII